MFKFLQIRSLYANCTSLFQSFKKQYCSSKKTELKASIALNKIPDHEAFGVLAEDEEALQKILSEKEKDACVQSRLSKEYRTILINPVKKLDKGTVGLILDPGELKSPCWDENIKIEEYAFSLVNAPDPCKENKIEEPLGKDVSKPPSISAGSTTVPGANPGPKSANPPKPSDGAKGSGQSGGDSSKASSQSFGRPVRQEPGQVFFAFIPVEWWQFFIPKTGVSGFWTFVVTFSTYLVSKEIYVLEHNYYGGLSMVIMVWATIKYIGPFVSKNLDKAIDEFDESYSKLHTEQSKALEEEIVNEKLMQFQNEGQELLIQAKRENVGLQLEENYRLRLKHAYEEVKKRLDLQVQLEMTRNRYLHKNLIEYVQKEVMKSISPDVQDKLIYYSIDAILKELDKDKGNKK